MLLLLASAPALISIALFVSTLRLVGLRTVTRE
jgi:hypothetical protein